MHRLKMIHLNTIYDLCRAQLTVFEITVTSYTCLYINQAVYMSTLCLSVH